MKNDEAMENVKKSDKDINCNQLGGVNSNNVQDDSIASSPGDFTALIMLSTGVLIINDQVE